MRRKYLSAKGLFESASSHFKKIPDTREVARSKGSLHDALMSALAVFSLKSPYELKQE